jgi:hypothetical protein
MDLMGYQIEEILIEDAASPLSHAPEKRVIINAIHRRLPEVRIVMRYQYWPSEKPCEEGDFTLVYSASSLEINPLVLLSPTLRRGLRDFYNEKIIKVLETLSWSKYDF